MKVHDNNIPTNINETIMVYRPLLQRDRGREQQDHLIEEDIPDRGSTSTGGIGESPTTSSRSRFGRNRTGTMVFAKVEATAIADELAA